MFSQLPFNWPHCDDDSVAVLKASGQSFCVRSKRKQRIMIWDPEGFNITTKVCTFRFRAPTTRTRFHCIFAFKKWIIQSKVVQGGPFSQTLRIISLDFFSILFWFMHKVNVCLSFCQHSHYLFTGGRYSLFFSAFLRILIIGSNTWSVCLKSLWKMTYSKSRC